MSFSEMMSSARGPGVIGTAMALAVMAIFVLLFIFAFDERFQGGRQSIHSVIAQQELDLANYRSSIADGEKSLARLPALASNAKDLTRLNRENRAQEENIVTLRKNIESAKEDVETRNSAFEGYKDQYRGFVRNKAKGETMETLETLGGVTYKNVNIREVTAIGIQIRHDEGQKRIPYEELPEAMKDHFQFDASQKAAALAKEQETWNEHEAAVSASDKQAGEHANKSSEDSKAKYVRMLAVKEARVTSLGDEIRSLEAAIQREGLKGISRAPEMRERLAAKQSELSALRSDIARLRAVQ